jgi:L-histidine N-alpha-methyltransferase
MNIALLLPPATGTPWGRRWSGLHRAAILRRLGHRVRPTGEVSSAADLVVADVPGLSGEDLAALRRRHPRARVVAAFAPGDGADPLALAEADRIVVPHPRAVNWLPSSLRERARTILPSAAPPARRPRPIADRFEVAVIGDLRDGPDPLRPAAAARLLPAGSRLQLLHLGAADCGRTAGRVDEEEAGNLRFRWLGTLRRPRAREVLSRCRLLVLPPGPGGACGPLAWALAAGVPVLASRGGGAVAILGDAYPGLFAPWDEEGLAALLVRAEADPAFLRSLAAWCERLRPLCDPARERAAWAHLLAEVSNFPTGAGHCPDKFETPKHIPSPSAPRDRTLPAPAPASARLAWIDLGTPGDDFAAAVREGLTAPRKSLPCRFLYDEEGSRLFDEICRLPEYYPTRTEDGILAAHARDIAAALPAGATVFELGSGSAGKTRRLLAALLERQGRVLYAPLDISPAALRSCAADLLPSLPGLELRAIVGTYDDGLSRLADLVPGPRLLLWLGSSIGNLEREEAAAFLGRIRAAMGAGDRLLLGVDRKKDRRILERAYNDAAGVTARFDENLLVRIDRELGGHFHRASFRHRAIWNEEAGRIEMHLASTRPQTVRIDALDLEVAFAEGETIHTESSHKYAPEEIDALAAAARLVPLRRFEDGEGRFVDVLLGREPETSGA